MLCAPSLSFLPPLVMAGRLLPLPLLLFVSLALARASPRQFEAEDSRRCPRLEDGLPPFATALRPTCRVSAEGYPADQINGQEAVAYIGPRKWNTAQSMHNAKLWNSSTREIMKSEPYLAFSIMFICLRIFLLLYQKFFAVIKDFWMQYFWHINLGVLAKLTQLLECVPHALDVRKIWSKWRLMVGVKNAKVLESSLASVSLGRQSSTSCCFGLMGFQILTGGRERTLILDVVG